MSKEKDFVSTSLGETCKNKPPKLTQLLGDIPDESFIKAINDMVKKYNDIQFLTFSRDEAISILHDEPGMKITHRLFGSEEYLIGGVDGNVYDENGYLFETWDDNDLDHNGIRMRTGGDWEYGWHYCNK